MTVLAGRMPLMPPHSVSPAPRPPQGLRDPLNDRRRDLVQQAFAKLDTDGSGTIDPAEVARAYDASKHPEVIAGRMQPEQVLQEFLDTFDVGGEVDGKVTAERFLAFSAIVASCKRKLFFPPR